MRLSDLEKPNGFAGLRVKNIESDYTEGEYSKLTGAKFSKPIFTSSRLIRNAEVADTLKSRHLFIAPKHPLQFSRIEL